MEIASSRLGIFAPPARKLDIEFITWLIILFGGHNPNIVCDIKLKYLVT